jgi:hypothetical protein
VKSENSSLFEILVIYISTTIWILILIHNPAVMHL